MDVSAPRAPRSLPALAALALVLMGAALSVITWRNLEAQRRVIDQHALFAARTILRGVEANFMRLLPHLGRMPRDQAVERLEDLLREVVESGDLLFLGIYGEDGELHVSSAPRHANNSLRAPLDQDALADLAITGEWFGTLPLGGLTMLGYAARMRPGMARLCPATPETPPGQEAPPVYFLVGLSLDEHYAQYNAMRTAALMQTGFVLGAAALVWVLLVALLRRREQSRRLVRLEHFHSRLLDSLPEALLTVDAQGFVSAANPAAAALLGPNLPGRDFASLPLAAALQTGHPEPQPWKQLDLDGRNLEVLVAPLEDETLLLLRDRTKLRSLERDLEQSRHLAAVGRLAAGVAHEIRNPLSALRGFSQFFAAKLKGKDPEETYANTMVQEADRLGRVVTDLLYLARPRPSEPAPVHLPELAAELETLLRFDFQRAQASFETDLKADTAVADRDGLKQALINLILNGLASLPEHGGVITLASRETPDGVSLSVIDTGRGMEPEEKRRALEPFFTTRKEGSGLGLAIVHKIVRDHLGQLHIDSEPGQGAAVTLTFRHAPLREQQP
ncbi:Sensor protein ZraS [Fundidesulfovibrio magnetotacticus]|uniref:histidine kinase n=1 Tax=Fundidesulfovibrio magnetotacticus TaxID=2730080 RepID=A0A6V8M0Q8_9BACT|nr:ATP-binding protein [Fundidesulfovibrio magnetotacticus]GFK95596.1 Sensor protein ZraS [Fundidesulfovibrio magnetotacticus]